MTRKPLSRNHPRREIVSVHPSGAPGVNIGRMKMLGLLAALVIFLAAGLSPAMAASPQDEAPKIPDFSILANDGQTYTPYYLKGNVVLLMFWATWCPYCRKAIPHMNDFASEYANAPFTLLGICGSKDPDRLARLHPAASVAVAAVPGQQPSDGASLPGPRRAEFLPD